MGNEKRELRILIINTVTFMKGGMSTVIMNYFENLDKDRIHMDFVVNKEIEAGYRTKMERKGSEVYLLERNTEPVKYFFSLLAIIKSGNYDIVHVHGNSCTMAIELFAAMLCGCKRRVAHSHSSGCNHIKAHKLLRPVFEMCCTERLACSKEAGKWLFQGREYTIVENAMNLEKYCFDMKKRIDIRQQMGIEENEILIGYVGIFVNQKNQKFTVDVLESLRKENAKYKLVLVGEGELRGEIEEYVRQKNLENVSLFYGETDDVTGIMSAMDIFLFPSKLEGLGIVMVEAQLTGLPCIASKQVPEATKITDYCQYLELSAPIETWCDAVRKAEVEGTNRLKVRISEEGKKRFDIKEQVGKLEGIYWGQDCTNYQNE
ncbi:MAG: glycosyltransferase family 1 protein [Lachnospiraceae bacterium]|nr:glycosyltransferase family 1 protein [Lachnospiraceae bacterium]